jgi:hypothetical protein
MLKVLSKCLRREALFNEPVESESFFRTGNDFS